jgi:ActR/RegA family two-component response regulator
MVERSDRPVLILDDEVIVALDLAQTVEEAGFVVSGPFHASAPTLDAIDQAVPAAAILDVNLGGTSTSREVAQKLQALDVPFVFLTGYDVAGSDVLESFPDVERVSKPVDMSGIVGWLRRATTR